MTRDRAEIMRLSFFLGITGAFEAWSRERRIFSVAMLPLVCASLVMLASMFLSVKATILTAAILMLVMAYSIVETSRHIDEKLPIYFSFFISGAFILSFGLLQSGALALVDAPTAIIPIIAFFLFGGSSLVGLVRFLDHV